MNLKDYQDAIDIHEQIINLKALGLIINDEAFASEFLNDVSYYRFIKAYSLGLKAKNGNYSSGVTFAQLVELYLFNANFRQILFPQIEKIEINLRCRVSNYFSVKYGPLGHLDSQNFANAVYHAAFIKEALNETNRNMRSPFIKNFKTNYQNGHIPFYALVEILSFGTLSKFFKNLKNEDKKAIAKTYGIGYNYFESWIEAISYIRNICAHYGRLYNAKLSKTPMLYKRDRSLKLSSIRIFGTLLCMKHLLVSDKHWNSFIDSINILFQKYPHVKKETMGFPDNWLELLRH